MAVFSEVDKTRDYTVYEQPPFEKYGIIIKGKGAVISYAVAPRKLGLHNKRTCWQSARTESTA